MYSRADSTLGTYLVQYNKSQPRAGIQMVVATKSFFHPPISVKVRALIHQDQHMSCWKVNSITLGGGGGPGCCSVTNRHCNKARWWREHPGSAPLEQPAVAEPGGAGTPPQTCCNFSISRVSPPANTSERHRNYTALLCAQKFNKHLQLEGMAIKMLAPPTTRTW